MRDYRLYYRPIKTGFKTISPGESGRKVDAPKNRGDFNDCLPYENSYINPAILQATALELNYFLIVSVVTVVLTVESVTTIAESGATGVTIVVESVVETSSTFLSSPLEQDANDAATTANTNNFFIFLCFNLLFND